MRVGDATFYAKFLAGLERSRSRSGIALEGLADGKKVRLASADPAGAAESLALRGRWVRLQGFSRSGGSAESALVALENVL
jgi:hypothetical protein